MEVIRVGQEWQRAGVFAVRYETMCEGFGVPLEGEFGQDGPQDEYILVMEGEAPVSTCRIRMVDDVTGQVERVATRPGHQGHGYGRAAILGAEAWLAEKGARTVLINAREAALGFYEGLGYVADTAQESGGGEFRCVMTSKRL